MTKRIIATFVALFCIACSAFGQAAPATNTAPPTKPAPAASAPAAAASAAVSVDAGNMMKLGKAQIDIGEAEGVMMFPNGIPTRIRGVEKPAAKAHAKANAQASAKVAAKAKTEAEMPGRVLTIACDGVIRGQPIPDQETVIYKMPCAAPAAVLPRNPIRFIDPAPVSSTAPVSAAPAATATATAAATASGGAATASASAAASTSDGVSPSTAHVPTSGTFWGWIHPEATVTNKKPCFADRQITGFPPQCSSLEVFPRDDAETEQQWNARVAARNSIVTGARTSRGVVSGTQFGRVHVAR